MAILTGNISNMPTLLKVSNQAETLYLAVKFTVHSIRTADSVCKLRDVFCRCTMHTVAYWLARHQFILWEHGFRAIVVCLISFQFSPVFTAHIGLTHKRMTRLDLVSLVNVSISRGQIMACDVQNFKGAAELFSTVEILSVFGISWSRGGWLPEYVMASSLLTSLAAYNIFSFCVFYVHFLLVVVLFVASITQCSR